MSVNSWWGRHSLEPGRVDFWELGPLKVWIHPVHSRWQIAWTSSRNWLDSHVRIAAGMRGEEPPADAQRANCAFGAVVRHELIFAPILSDRSLITRLAVALRLLPSEALTLYVLSPLNLRIESIEPQKLVHEIPTFRLSDTWFGPMNSSEGELCYAGSTPAFLDLQEVPLRLHCAITAVTVRNLGPDPMILDRIKVPLRRLSLFHSPRTGFWTDSIILERREGNEMAALGLNHQPPPEASPSQIITTPRDPHQDISMTGHAIRSFGALLRERGLS